MDQIIFAYALLSGLAICLLVSVYTDIKYRLIYNKVSAAIALGAPLYWLAINQFGWPQVGFFIGGGVLTFLFFAIFFRFGMMGGGDVKLFAAVALWLPPVELIRFLFNASVLGAAVTVLFFITHKLRKGTGPVRVPYGVAIAIAGLWSAGEQFFKHFG
ncbi:MAG: prepilin peptidase [Sphingorhabdus sp.]|nr:prepilin peptidase [Sphingorhabdus sp.]